VKIEGKDSNLMEQAISKNFFTDNNMSEERLLIAASDCEESSSELFNQSKKTRPKPLI